MFFCLLGPKQRKATSQASARKREKPDLHLLLAISIAGPSETITRTTRTTTLTNIKTTKKEDGAACCFRGAGDVMFQADYFLKELALGEYSMPVVGMSSVFDFSEMTGKENQWAGAWMPEDVDGGWVGKLCWKRVRKRF